MKRCIFKRTFNDPSNDDEESKDDDLFRNPQNMLKSKRRKIGTSDSDVSSIESDFGKLLLTEFEQK